jgi:hypothetical protein
MHSAHPENHIVSFLIFVPFFVTFYNLWIPYDGSGFHVFLISGIASEQWRMCNENCSSVPGDLSAGISYRHKNLTRAVLSVQYPQADRGLCHLSTAAAYQARGQTFSILKRIEVSATRHI